MCVVVGPLPLGLWGQSLLREREKRAQAQGWPATAEIHTWMHEVLDVGCRERILNGDLHALILRGSVCVNFAWVSVR